MHSKGICSTRKLDRPASYSIDILAGTMNGLLTREIGPASSLGPKM